MQTFGRYQIETELGRGGMATVYRAHDPEVGRDVALKVMAEHFLSDPTFRQRFRQEARTVASLEHHAIVPLYDFGEEGNRQYIVMRLMSGGSLTQHLTNTPLPLSQISQIMSRICSALDYAHERDIVHRDLKPENILLDSEGQAYLADFGLARVIASSHTSGIVGTFRYTSPEQARGTVIDRRSDIYQMGIILFEMLSGKPPYSKESPAALVYQHAYESVPDVLALNSDLVPAWQLIIEKAMAKERESRYKTAGELEKDIRELVGEINTPNPALASFSSEEEAAFVSTPSEDVETTLPETKDKRVPPSTLNDATPTVSNPVSRFRPVIITMSVIMLFVIGGWWLLNSSRLPTPQNENTSTSTVTLTPMATLTEQVPVLGVTSEVNITVNASPIPSILGTVTPQVTNTPSPSLTTVPSATEAASETSTLTSTPFPSDGTVGPSQDGTAISPTNTRPAEATSLPATNTPRPNATDIPATQTSPSNTPIPTPIPTNTRDNIPPSPTPLPTATPAPSATPTPLVPVPTVTLIPTLPTLLAPQ